MVGVHGAHITDPAMARTAGEEEERRRTGWRPVEVQGGDRVGGGASEVEVEGQEEKTEVGRVMKSSEEKSPEDLSDWSEQESPIKKGETEKVSSTPTFGPDFEDFGDKKKQALQKLTESKRKRKFKQDGEKRKGAIKRQVRSEWQQTGYHFTDKEVTFEAWRRYLGWRRCGEEGGEGDKQVGG